MSSLVVSTDLASPLRHLDSDLLGEETSTTRSARIELRERRQNALFVVKSLVHG